MTYGYHNGAWQCHVCKVLAMSHVSLAGLPQKDSEKEVAAGKPVRDAVIAWARGASTGMMLKRTDAWLDNVAVDSDIDAAVLTVNGEMSRGIDWAAREWG
jgi:hypothetical protein